MNQGQTCQERNQLPEFTHEDVKEVLCNLDDVMEEISRKRPRDESDDDDNNNNNSSSSHSNSDDDASTAPPQPKRMRGRPRRQQSLKQIADLRSVQGQQQADIMAARNAYLSQLKELLEECTPVTALAKVHLDAHLEDNEARQVFGLGPCAPLVFEITDHHRACDFSKGWDKQDPENKGLVLQVRDHLVATGKTGAPLRKYLFTECEFDKCKLVDIVRVCNNGRKALKKKKGVLKAIKETVEKARGDEGWPTRRSDNEPMSLPLMKE